MGTILLCTVSLTCVLVCRLRASYILRLLYVAGILLIWNECILSDLRSSIFVCILLIACGIAYKTKSLRSVTITSLILILPLLLLTKFQPFIPVDETSDTKETLKIADAKTKVCASLQGTKMGDGYKANFNALQGCTIYKGKLYQFFHNGYYEIRDVETMLLEREGHLALPISIHFGSVQFGMTINKGCTMPYLYATDDNTNCGNVYIIDFEKQTVIANYDIKEGCIAAYDFESNTGYLTRTSGEHIGLKAFDLSSGEEKSTAHLSAGRPMEMLQSAIFNKGFIYLLSGQTGSSMIITKINADKQQIEDIYEYPFDGEPEGLTFTADGNLIITAAIGSWTEGRGTDRYIHSEYFVISKEDI